MSKKEVIIVMVIMFATLIGITQYMYEMTKIEEEFYKEAYRDMLLSSGEEENYNLLYDKLISDPILNDYLELTLRSDMEYEQDEFSVKFNVDYKTHKAYYNETLPKELQPIYDEISKVSTKEILFKVRHLERAIILGRIPEEVLAYMDYIEFMELKEYLEYDINYTHKECSQPRWAQCYHYGLKYVYRDIKLIEYFYTLYIEMKDDKEKQEKYKKVIQDDFNERIKEWNELYATYEEKEKFEGIHNIFQEMSSADDIMVYFRLQMALAELKFEIRRMNMSQPLKKIDYDRMADDLWKRIESNLAHYRELIPENCSTEEGYYYSSSCEGNFTEDSSLLLLMDKYNDAKQIVNHYKEENQTGDIEMLLWIYATLEGYLNAKEKVLKNSSHPLEYATLEDINIGACIDVKNPELGKLYVNKILEAEYQYEQTYDYYENIFYTHLNYYDLIYTFRDVQRSEEKSEYFERGIDDLLPYTCVAIAEQVEKLKLMMEHDIEKYYVEEEK